MAHIAHNLGIKRSSLNPNDTRIHFCVLDRGVSLNWFSHHKCTFENKYCVNIVLMCYFQKKNVNIFPMCTSQVPDHLPYKSEGKENFYWQLWVYRQTKIGKLFPHFKKPLVRKFFRFWIKEWHWLQKDKGEKSLWVKSLIWYGCCL